jgi:hypothetical protein
MTVFLPLVLTVLAAGVPLQSGQPGASPPASTEPARATDQPPPGDAAESSASLRRIQRALSRPPAIRLSGDRSVFRVEVIGKKPTIEDILGPDYLKGPVPYGGMTHQEFLNMVTPKDVQGYAAFNNREAFAVAATSIALQWALQKAIHKFQTAKQEREREAARKEVQDALAELEKARLKAGLPPK